MGILVGRDGVKEGLLVLINGTRVGVLVGGRVIPGPFC